MDVSLFLEVSVQLNSAMRMHKVEWNGAGNSFAFSCVSKYSLVAGKHRLHRAQDRLTILVPDLGCDHTRGTGNT